MGDRKLPADCIKILYEVAELRPDLLTGCAPPLIELLGHKNNRLVWGAMVALDAIAELPGDLLYTNLDKLSQAAAIGSVITRDHYVGILTKLAPRHSDVMPLILSQLANSPVNQFPMYAEKAAPVITENEREEFVAILTRRLPEMNNTTKKTRIGKVLKNLAKLSQAK